MGKRVSSELKAQILNEVKEVGNIRIVADKHGITSKSIHNWLRYSKSENEVSQTKQLRELNKKLKDAELENLVLKELLKKTYPRWKNADDV